MSEKQKAIFILLANGKTTTDIAIILNVSVNTIRDHIRTVLVSRSYNNITEAVYKLTKSNIL